MASIDKYTILDQTEHAATVAGSGKGADGVPYDWKSVMVKPEYVEENPTLQDLAEAFNASDPHGSDRFNAADLLAILNDKVRGDDMTAVRPKKVVIRPAKTADNAAVAMFNAVNKKQMQAAAAIYRVNAEKFGEAFTGNEMVQGLAKKVGVVEDNEEE